MAAVQGALCDAGEVSAPPTLRQVASDLLAAGRWKEALRRATEERRLCQGRGDASGEAVACQVLAEAHLRAGDAEEALEAASEARAMCRRDENARGEASALVALAWGFLSKGEGEEAKEAAKEARSICQKAKDVEGETMALHTLKDLCLAISKDVVGGEALDAIKEARAISKQAGDPKLEALSLHAASHLHCLKRESKEALETASEARALYKQAGEVQGELAALDTIASLHYSEAELQKAREAVSETCSLSERSGDLWTKAAALHGLFAHLALAGQDKDAASKTIQEARAVAQQLQDRRLESAMLQSLSRVHAISKEAEESRQAAAEALQVLRGSGDGAAEAGALLQVASLRDAGDFKGKTPPEVDEAKRLLRAAKDHRGEARMLVGYAKISLDHGAVGEAVGIYGEAAAAAAVAFAGRGEKAFGIDPAKLLAAEAEVLREGAEALRDAGHVAEASQLAGQAARKYRVAGKTTDHATALTLVSGIHLRALGGQDARDALLSSAASLEARRARGHRASALRAAEEAVRVLRGLEEDDDKAALAAALHNIASAKILARDTEGALLAAEEAQDIFQQLGDEVCEAATLVALAQAYLLAGRSRGAARAAEEARELFRKAGVAVGDLAVAEVLDAAWRRSGARDHFQRRLKGQ